MSNSEKFSVDSVGEVSGKTWKGVFTTKIRLSHRDQLRQDELRRDLLGKNPETASARAQNQAEIFSTIYAHITDTPQWWGMFGNGLDLEDDNVVAEVYGKILEIKAEAQKKKLADADAAKTEIAKTVEK